MLQTYSNGSYCRRCPLSAQGCPFEASYEQLEAELFKPMPSIRSTDVNGRQRSQPRPSGAQPRRRRPGGPGRPRTTAGGDGRNRANAVPARFVERAEVGFSRRGSAP